jgi:TonB family protein
VTSGHPSVCEEEKEIMKILLVVILTFAGCAFFSETQKPDTLPELVFRTALPAVPADWAGSRPKIEVLFHVSRTGTITDASFVDSPGAPAWESRALEEMKQWRFSPARVGEDSVPVWVRVPIIVRFNAKYVLNLAQLVCADQASADSAYQLLLAGHPFETIVRELPSAGSGTYEKNIGKTDISVYAKEIQDELTKLKENGFTRPLQIGNSFVIFKRLPKNPVSGV